MEEDRSKRDWTEHEIICETSIQKDTAAVQNFIYFTDLLKLLLEYYILSRFFSYSRKTIPGFISGFGGFIFKYLTTAEEKKRERERDKFSNHSPLWDKQST